ncbi:MAG: DUF935 domain-containing protein [Treponema sp.]|jgi:phage gp29-like protein|nr:DUF935 domain-containing protein [Treponema sp.]
MTQRLLMMKNRLSQCLILTATLGGDFSLLQSLTPERLAEILNNLKRGECPAEYLEPAHDIALKDLHYRSVRSTRKDTITGLEITVVPASEDKRDRELADAVERDIVKNTTAKRYSLIRDMLDAIAKVYLFALCEHALGMAARQIRIIRLISSPLLFLLTLLTVLPLSP